MRLNTARATRALVVALLFTCPAGAQYAATFETPAFIGSPNGVPLAGQDGFYLPAPGLVDGACYSYAANALGVIAHPAGGAQFIACTRSVNDYARAQRDVTFSGEDCWVVRVDFNLLHNGPLPTTNYAGSISLQPFPGASSVIILMNWDSVANPTAFTIRVLGYDADGDTPFLGGLPVDSPAFHGLLANHWYRLGLRLEFGQNALSAISIRDLHSAAPAVGFVPDDLEGYYLGGGAAGGDRPTAIRFFGGGGFQTDHVAGNTLAIDNVTIVPTGESACPADIDLDGAVSLHDVARLLGNFGITAGAVYADGDLDCDGDVDIDDLSLMLANYGVFCDD